MTTTTKTIKTENFTAVVTNPGTRGFQFKLTKGTATRRQVRRAIKRTLKAVAPKPAATKKPAAKK